MEGKPLEISWVSLWRVLFFVVLVALLYVGLQIFLGLFLAIVISAGLDFIVNFLEARGLPRTLGVILVFLAGALVLIITVYTVIPLTIVDLNTIFSSLNKVATKDSWLAPLVSLKTTQSFGALVNRISTQFLSGGNSPLGAFSDLVGGVVLAVSIIVSSFYLSLTESGVERFLRAILPADSEEEGIRIYTRARKKIGVWFRTQILLSVVMGTIMLVALLLLGVPHPLLLAILAGIFELVPYVGPILAGSAAVLAAFAVSPGLALSTLIVALLIHQFEGHFLVPVLMGRSVGLHPVVVIIALLVGAEVQGLLGILIAVPAAVVLQEVLEDRSGRKKMRDASA